MSFFLLLVALCSPLICHADLSDYFKKDLKKENQNSLRNIDYIYLINLDQRPEKFKKCIDQLTSYNITPYRFSAVKGWELSAEDLRNIGVRFSPEMSGGDWVRDANNDFKLDFLREEMYGKTVFFRTMTVGAIGCTLSHLSVLQDAYDSKYKTIWVLEDDIVVKKDPNLLSELIDKLDSLVGENGWDVLYTDMDVYDGYLESSLTPAFEAVNNFESDLQGTLDFFWRPNYELPDPKYFAKRSLVGDEFVKIGSRNRTHSMVIRRSGIEKILNYEKKYKVFLPYDLEVASVPGIRMFNLRQDLVTLSVAISDTQGSPLSPKAQWEKVKKEALAYLPQFEGWFSSQKADKLMEFIYSKKPTTCVEIGAFTGSTTFQIATVLEFFKSGTVYAIDAWDAQVATEGLEGMQTIQWWKDINLKLIKEKFDSLFLNKPTKSYCIPIHQRSEDAVSKFQDHSIDFLYIDGNDSKKWNTENIKLYFPKVKEGGYICFNRALSGTKLEATAFLMKNCYWIKDDLSEDCLFFQKKPTLLIKEQEEL